MKTTFEKSPERKAWEAEKVQELNAAPTWDEFCRILKEAEEEKAKKFRE